MSVRTRKHLPILKVNNGPCKGVKKINGVVYRLQGDFVAKFHSRYEIKANGCWEWIAGKDAFGYGILSTNRKNTRAHRFSWELHNEREAGELQVLHKCDNPPCVNPEHLFLGTPKDNAVDRAQKNRGTCLPGEKNPSAKLRVHEVIQIFNDNRSCRVLAEIFGTNKSTVSQIKRRLIWKKDISEYLDKQAQTHDNGCAGCQRPADKRITLWNHDLISTYKGEK